MKAQKQSEKKENTSQIIQRKDGNSFVKSKADANSFTPPRNASPKNKAIPSDLKSNMEHSLGQDFSSVSIHTNSQKAIQMQARAYTQGDQVHFAPGEFNPTSTEGKNLIGHEFTHVAQQRAGVVKPTKILQKGVAINDTKSLEQEADTFGKKAAKGEHVSKYRGKTSSTVAKTTQHQLKTKGNLSEQLTNALSPVQMQSTIVQFALKTDITNSLQVNGPIYFDGIIASIRSATTAERQAVLGDTTVMNLIRSSLPADSVARIMSELMVGSQKWKNPRGSKFYQYFVVGKGTGELPTTATMNCWESILYAAYLAGQIDTKWIYDFYNKAGVVLGTKFTSPKPIPKVWAALGWTAALPVVNSSGVVSEGDLVFYTRPKKSYPAHVAVYVGNDEVISLWTAPKGINSVQRIPIDSFPGTTIQYGPKPW